MQDIQPGIYPDIPIEEYHSGPGVSSGQLRVYGASPFKYDWIVNKKHPKKTTPDMFLGQLVHCAVLEPQLFTARYARMPSDLDSLNKNSNAYKDRAAMLQLEAMERGQVLLPGALFDKVVAMAESVWSYEPAARLLRGGIYEESLYWNDPVTGILCRCRPDCRRRKRLIVDLKKTADSEKGPFMASASSFKYHVQMAFYMEGATIATGEVYDQAAFITIEDEEPYVVRVYELDEGAKEKGRELHRRYLDCMAISLRDNYWPRTLSAITDQNEIEMLGLVHYAFYE